MYDSSVRFYHYITIQPTAGCLSRQSETTRFHFCFVHECNFHAFCITENTHTKHEKQTERKTHDIYQQVLCQQHV